MLPLHDTYDNTGHWTSAHRGMWLKWNRQTDDDNTAIQTLFAPLPYPTAKSHGRAERQLPASRPFYVELGTNTHKSGLRIHSRRIHCIPVWWWCVATFSTTSVYHILFLPSMNAPLIKECWVTIIWSANKKFYNAVKQSVQWEERVGCCSIENLHTHIRAHTRFH